MQINLSDHFTYKKLLRFVFPSIVMMIFTSVYGVVDGFFVSNYAGKTAFAAVNLIMPLPMILGTVGFMLGSGGSAVVAKALGEKKKDLAVDCFSLMVAAALTAGAALSAAGLVFLKPIAKKMGADGELLGYCLIYGRILLLSNPCFSLQNIFQTFMVTDERPDLGLKITLAAGCANMVLDYLLVGVLDMGVAGAGLATAASQTIGGIWPLVFFMTDKKGLLRLKLPTFRPGVLVRASINGLSELLVNVSLSLVNILYNFQLLKFAGEDGIAAYGVIMYVGFIFIAVFIGYSVGSAPVVSFHYGAGNRSELRGLLKKGLTIVAVCGILMMAAAMAMAHGLSGFFVGYDADLQALTEHAFALYSISYLYIGFNILSSGFFTALSNGLVSGIISFLRTFVFQVAAVLLLPEILGIDGIWLAICLAEALALAVSAFFIITCRKTYGY